MIVLHPKVLSDLAVAQTADRNEVMHLLMAFTAYGCAAGIAELLLLGHAAVEPHFLWEPEGSPC